MRGQFRATAGVPFSLIRALSGTDFVFCNSVCCSFLPHLLYARVFLREIATSVALTNCGGGVCRFVEFANVILTLVITVMLLIFSSVRVPAAL